MTVNFSREDKTNPWTQHQLKRSFTWQSQSGPLRHSHLGVSWEIHVNVVIDRHQIQRIDSSHNKKGVPGKDYCWFPTWDMEYNKFGTATCRQEVIVGLLKSMSGILSHKDTSKSVHLNYQVYNCGRQIPEFLGIIWKNRTFSWYIGDVIVLFGYWWLFFLALKKADKS